MAAASPEPKPTVVVTGAGGGIGAATARLLAEAGTSLVLVGRSRGALEETVASLPAGAAVVVHSADVSSASDCRAIARTATETFGRIDGIVNSAGVSMRSPLEELSHGDLARTYEVNAIGPVQLTLSCLDGLRASASPSVVMLSSALAVVPKADQLAYGMSKAALEYATRALAHGLAQYGIRVNAIAPGPVASPIHDTLFDDLEAAYARMSATTLVGRLGNVDEVATWVTKLLDPSSAWVTGSVIRVDGGRTVWPITAA